MIKPETNIAEEKRLLREAFGEPAGFLSDAHENEWLRVEARIQKLIVTWGYQKWRQFEADRGRGEPPPGPTSTVAKARGKRP